MFSVSSFLETSPNPTGVSSEENKTLGSTVKIAEWDKAYTSSSGSERAGFLKEIHFVPLFALTPQGSEFLRRSRTLPLRRFPSLACGFVP